MVAPIGPASAKVFQALEQKLLTILKRNMQIVEAVGTPFASRPNHRNGDAGESLRCHSSESDPWSAGGLTGLMLRSKSINISKAEASIGWVMGSRETEMKIRDSI
jgi:hypothetical protein